jgi:hypothetical protein
VSSKLRWSVLVLTWSRYYTVQDLSEHYVRCGHRLSGVESEKILDMVSGKYSRNPRMGEKEAEKKLAWLKKRRKSQTKGLYRESGQSLMQKYVAAWRPNTVPGSKKNED